MLKRDVIGYHRPFPWYRIGSNRTGRTTVVRGLRAFCREQDLHLISALTETDDRLQRTLDDRTVGREIMKALRSSEARGIVVARLEHAFSSSSEALTSVERWLDEGYSFYCVDFLQEAPLILTPKGTRAGSRSLISGLADFQRRIDAERTRQRVLNRKSRGSWTGRVPFGFHLIDGRLVEEEDRIARIQRMKSAHRRGQSYRQIAVDHEISVGTAHRLVKTDLRKLRRIGQDLNHPAEEI